MTSAQELVVILQFKKLAKQLTDNEFNVFMANVSKVFDHREYLLNLLCNKFNKPSNTIEIINKMTKMITKIIQNRCNTNNDNNSKCNKCKQKETYHNKTSSIQVETSMKVLGATSFEQI